MPAFKKSILARMRRNGISVNAIARATGTSAAAVGKALSDFGLGRVKASRAPRKPRIQVAEVRQEVAQAVPVAHAANNPFGL